jgi:DNA-binding transcriptional regulator YdaS (Cro superfamily)
VAFRLQKAHDCFAMPNLRAQTLARAAQIVGGADVLAEQLAVVPETLRRYLRGNSPVPLEIFLRATEIVTEASVGDAANVLQPEQKPTP